METRIPTNMPLSTTPTFRKILWGMETAGRTQSPAWGALSQCLERSYEGWKRRQAGRIPHRNDMTFRKILWGMETFGDGDRAKAHLEFRKILWGMETKTSKPYSSASSISLERSYEGWKHKVLAAFRPRQQEKFRKILWGMETQKGACFALSKAGLCLERSYEGWKLIRGHKHPLRGDENSLERSYEGWKLLHDGAVIWPQKKV